MNKDDILKQARSHMADAVEADKDNRLEDMDDLEKLVGKHWPESIRSDREGEDKPCLTLNRLPQFVRQVTGDIRRMNPSIKVLPADDEAMAETADIYEGLIRQIEYASDASSVYERAAEQAAASSIGWFRVLTDYESDDSFLQEIKIKSIRNPLSVYCDPGAELPTREDAGYMFITEQIRQDDFEKQYPKARKVDFDHDNATDGLDHWHQHDKIVVAEYFYKEPVKKEIVQLENGQILDAKDVVGPLRIVRKREVNTHKVMWTKITGQEVLEGPQEVPCKNIPVIAITGEEWHVADRVHRSSVIRHAKDAQQMYNYFRSAQVEFSALQPKAPYLVTGKQIAGLETIWNQANTKNRPYLVYTPDEKAPAPQRMTPPISSQAMFDQAMIAADDMKATTGIYDSALGNQSNEQSGVAIRQRQMESDVSTSIYADNMAKAIGACGRVIVDMIPKVYDTNRTLRILGDEDEEKMIEVNASLVMDNVQIPVNDLTVGKYDIKVSVGPNYATKRQETAEGMLGLVQANPALMQIIGDMLVKSMDWPDADKIAERIKRAMPPELTQEGEEDPRVQMLTQQVQQLSQALEAMQQSPELRKANAEATEAEADAQKAQFEVFNEQFELAAKDGRLQGLIEAQVMQALQRITGQPMM